MKKLLLLAITLLLSISLLACTNVKNGMEQEEMQDKETIQQIHDSDEEAVADFVEEFGTKLRMVSLLAPKDVLEKSMKEHYGEYVSQALIDMWLNDPENAPGRITSSPWPDRIEVRSVKKVNEGMYEVKGEIIEITSTEKESGGIAAKRPITLAVRKLEKGWIIDDVSLGEYKEAVSLKAFFPLSKGSTWQYLGEGNEYATFTRKVLFTEGDRAQIAEDNGGTVSASVFKITDNEIIRTFFRGEEYDGKNLLNEKDNDNLVVLKAPLKSGTKWKAGDGEREIVDTAAVVDTPAGKFEGCIKVRIQKEHSTMYEYYKAGIGMVKREFESEGFKVTSTLEKYEIK